MSMQARPLLGDGGEWILKTIKRNPEGLLLLAAGAVLMLRTNSTQSPQVATRPTYGDTENTARKTAGQMADPVTETARGAMDTASSYASAASATARQTMDTAQSYAASAGEYVDWAKRAVGEQSDRVVQQTRSVTQGVLQNQPLAIVAVGLAAGAALAAAFPRTELEKETLGPMGDQMSRAAERFGGQVKQATSKAGEKLKSAAEERGLHTEGLKDLAGEVVDTFKTSLTGRDENTIDPAAPRPDSVEGNR
jgi:hypothetical protein